MPTPKQTLTLPSLDCMPRYRERNARTIAIFDGQISLSRSRAWAYGRLGMLSRLFIGQEKMCHAPSSVSTAIQQRIVVFALPTGLLFSFALAQIRSLHK